MASTKKKTKSTRNQVLIVESEKGGMGKSMVARVVTEQMLAVQTQFYLFDADSSTPNVGLTYKKELYERLLAFAGQSAPTLVAEDPTVPLELNERIIFSGDPSTYYKADRIFTYAEQQNVLLILPSQVKEYVDRWLDDNDVLEMIEDPANNIDIVRFFVTNGTPESLDLFYESVESTKGKIPYVLVKNRGVTTDIDWRWFDHDGKVAGYLGKYGFKSIDFPELSLDPLVKNKIMGEKIPFGEAMTSGWMEKQKPSIRRLNKWLREATIALGSTGYIPYHPNYQPLPATESAAGESLVTDNAPELQPA